MDFGFDKVYIWNSKSLKDRTVPLPQVLKQRLKAQVEYVGSLHAKDVADGYASTAKRHRSAFYSRDAWA